MPRAGSRPGLCHLQMIEAILMRLMSGPRFVAISMVLTRSTWFGNQPVVCNLAGFMHHIGSSR